MTNDPLSTLCVGRLTRLLELNSLEDLQILEDCAYVAQNVELEENHFHAAPVTCKNIKSNSTQVKNLFKFLSRKETPRVFGQQISESTVEFVIQLINYLKIDTGVEGLFRISGNKKRQEELKVIMNKGGKLNLSTEDSPYSPHDIAGVLKQFFAQLPEPLLTKQLYDCYQQLAGKLKEMDSVTAKKRKIDTLKFLFLLLPPLNRLLLKELVKLLAVVADNELNKMSAYNLGVVFAPNIVCTRQPLDSLSEFTENVEPFTDLVKFVIENADVVFQVPVEFLEECKEYLLKIAVNKEKDAEVPMTKSYCQQIDEKAFRKEAKDNTNQALMMLYSQMMDMPDGPMKDNFLEKFRQSYPGTPLFIPKSIKEMNKVSTSTDEVNTLRCPMTPKSNSNAAHLPKKSCSLPGLMTPVGSKTNSNEIMMSATKPPSTPSTPGQKVKQCLKRIRRRSVELFKPKQSKPTTPDVKRKSLKHIENSMSSIRSRANSFFSSARFTSTSSARGMKKSVSSPTLLSRPKQHVSDDEEHCNDIGVRKLNFGSDTSLHDGEVTRQATQGKENERPVSFTYGDNKLTGFVNFAFQDTPEKSVASKVTTPVIRKSLYPDTKKKIQTDARQRRVLKEKFEFQTKLAPKLQNPSSFSSTPSCKENFNLQPHISFVASGGKDMNKLQKNVTNVQQSNDTPCGITNEEKMKGLSLNGT